MKIREVLEVLGGLLVIALLMSPIIIMSFYVDPTVLPSEDILVKLKDKTHKSVGLSGRSLEVVGLFTLKWDKGIEICDLDFWTNGTTKIFYFKAVEERLVNYTVEFPKPTDVVVKVNGNIVASRNNTTTISFSTKGLHEILVLFS